MFTSNCSVTLFRRSLLNDGSSRYDGGSCCQGFFMKHFRSRRDGTQEDLSELLLPPEIVPAPGDMVEIDGVRRHIAGVRTCTGAEGIVKARRCTFVK